MPAAPPTIDEVIVDTPDAPDTGMMTAGVIPSIGDLGYIVFYELLSDTAQYSLED